MIWTLDVTATNKTKLYEKSLVLWVKVMSLRDALWSGETECSWRPILRYSCYLLCGSTLQLLNPHPAGGNILEEKEGSCTKVLVKCFLVMLNNTTEFVFGHILNKSYIFLYIPKAIIKREHSVKKNEAETYNPEFLINSKT